ncbi:MAG: response regulator [Deltaproteobacteria bacterium]|nr:response regulator [Deltaproteobacteria bacterium]
MNTGMDDNSDRQLVQPRVLIVDDESAMRRLLTQALGEISCSCEPVGTGEEAIEVLERERFDLAIVDKNLPGISGLDVARRALDLEPPVPVIMVTGYPSEESKQAANSLGVASYLAKPFGLYQLQRTVDLVLRTFGDDRSGIIPTSSTGLSLDEAPKEPAPADSAGREETDLDIVVVESDEEVRQQLHEVLVGLGLRAVAFATRYLAEVRVAREGCDLLIAGPDIIDQTRHWAGFTAEDRPFYTVAILLGRPEDEHVVSLPTSSAGLLEPPFVSSSVIAEIRRVIAGARG